MSSPALIVRPIHRLLFDLPDWRPVRTLHAARDDFELRELDTPQQAVATLETHARRFPAFVLYAPVESRPDDVKEAESLPARGCRGLEGA
jgi:hypothetical protein